MKVFILGTRGFPGIQGGVEKHCAELYPRLSELGCVITIIARKHYFYPEKRVPKWKNVNFLYLPSPRRKGVEAFFHSFLGSMVCIIKRPDIVHVHNIGPGIFIPLLCIFKIKTVLTYHSLNYLHKKWGLIGKCVLKAGEKLGIKFADKIIVVSKTTLNFLSKKYLKKNFTYIPNGVTSEKETKTFDMDNIKVKEYLFTACRFTPEKGVGDLIKAYRKIVNPKFRLVIAGDADHETAYSRRVKKLASETEGVVLTGYVSGKHLGELYSNAGLFVLPSYYEGLPIALLEALSYGLPVLVSDISQNREVQLENFRYFKPGDIDELAEKIKSLYKKGISRDEKDRYLNLIREKYNWENVAEETLKVYKSVIA